MENYELVYDAYKSLKNGLLLRGLCDVNIRTARLNQKFGNTHPPSCLNSTIVVSINCCLVSCSSCITNPVHQTFQNTVAGFLYVGFNTRDVKVCANNVTELV